MNEKYDTLTFIKVQSNLYSKHLTLQLIFLHRFSTSEYSNIYNICSPRSSLILHVRYYITISHSIAIKLLINYKYEF